MKFLLKITLTLLAILNLTHCETLSTALIEPPVMELKELRLNSISFTGVEFMAIFDADNKNNSDLSVDQIDYQMFIADKPLFTGTTKKQVQLKANQLNKIELPFEIKFKEAKLAFDEIIVKKSNQYLFQGTTQIGIFKIPFSKTGKFVAPEN